MKFEIHGFKELGEDLKKYERQLQQKVVKKATREGAKVILKAARANAPKRIQEWEGAKYAQPAGTLKKRGIRIERATRQPRHIVRDIIGFSKEAWYGRLVETGHKLVRKGKVIGHVAAKPFLRPAFDANHARAIEVMKATMEEETKKLQFQILQAK